MAAKSSADKLVEIEAELTDLQERVGAAPAVQTQRHGFSAALAHVPRLPFSSQTRIRETNTWGLEEELKKREEEYQGLKLRLEVRRGEQSASRGKWLSRPPRVAWRDVSRHVQRAA